MVAQKELLRSLDVVPDQFGLYQSMGFLETPLIPGNEPDDLRKALTRLGIRLLQAPRDLVGAITRFASKHTDFIWHLTPNDVGDDLVAHGESNSLADEALDDPEVRTPLLDFLSSKPWLKKNDGRLPTLRKVRFLPTTSGERVAAETADVYLPGGFSPPKGLAGRYRMLDTGPGGRWSELFTAMGVRALDGQVFVEQVLLPAFSTASTELCSALLLWLRDELRLVERELPDDQRKALRTYLRRTPILPLREGGLGAPREVYHPAAKEPAELLDDLARHLDMSRFERQKDLWFEFFHELDLPRRPLGRDLFRTIIALVDQTKTRGVDAVRDQLRKLVAHLRGA